MSAFSWSWKVNWDVYINDLKEKSRYNLGFFGFPKQEQFINKLKTEIDLNSNFVGIGAVLNGLQESS